MRLPQGGCLEEAALRGLLGGGCFEEAASTRLPLLLSFRFFLFSASFHFLPFLSFLSLFLSFPLLSVLAFPLLSFHFVPFQSFPFLPCSSFRFPLFSLFSRLLSCFGPSRACFKNPARSIKIPGAVTALWGRSRKWLSEEPNFLGWATRLS